MLQEAFNALLMELNGLIKLSASGMRHIGRKSIRCDMVWRTVKVALEYESTLTHLELNLIVAGERGRQRDKRLGRESRSGVDFLAILIFYNKEIVRMVRAESERVVLDVNQWRAHGGFAMTMTKGHGVIITDCQGYSL